jgi:hypothetical protein
VQILEEFGINVSLKIKTNVNRLWDSAPTFSSTFEVKKSSEYVSPQALASVFRSVFYRRLIFSIYTIEADKRGHDVCSGLGSSFQEQKDPVEFANGVMKIRADSIFNMSFIEKTLISALKGTSK